MSHLQTKTTDPQAKRGEILDRADFLLHELDGGDANRSQNEVYASHSTELRIVYENRDFAVSTSNAVDLFGVRTVLDGGRTGFLTINTSGDDALRSAAAEVRSLAALSPESEFQCIYDPSAFGDAGANTGNDFQRIDPALFEIDAAAAIAYTQRIVDEARRDPRVAIDRAEFSVNLSCSAVVNSFGVRRSSVRNSASWYIMGMARDGEEVTSFDYDGATVARRSDVEAELDASIGRFRESVLACLDPIRGQSYKGPVLLHPRTAMSFLGGLAATNCNGRMHQDGMSSWKDRIGDEVVSPALSVWEDPSNANRIQGWRPFDREGVPTQRHALIDSGRLQFLGHNCFTARRGGLAPTGNATGGARSQPGIGFSNFVVEIRPSGECVVLSEEDLFQRFGKGLLLRRFSGNVDQVSGNFSGVAKNSLWVEGGRPDRPVREIMVSGNTFDLARSILAAGDRLEELMGGGLVPYVLVDGVSVTAA